jgi:hypothetical protein
MDYVEGRNEIKSGDLLAFTHVGWKSWRDIKIQIVRMFTKSEYSHVGVAWVVGGRVFVLEAVVPLIRIYPLSKCGNFYHIPMDLNWTPDVEGFALSKVGEEYSQFEAILASIDKLEQGANNKWECAEYVKAVFGKAGVVLNGEATPTDVVRSAQELGKCTRLVRNS